MTDYGKRSRITVTRAGLEREIFFVCYNCPVELSEGDTLTHICEGV